MIKTEKDQIYNRLKSTVGFYRSKKFKKWFHENYPNSEMHHVFGSYTSIKTPDYCSAPLETEAHRAAEKNKSDAAIELLPIMLQVMQKYIIYLEGKK